MVFIKWLLCGCLSIPMTILGKALCWVLPFFVDEETKRLPKWLDWFMTDDNDADGDAGHWERNPGTGKWATYVRRTKWFWRNTCYGFDREAVGIKCWSTDVIEFTGDVDVGRKPFRPGANWHHLYRNGKLIGFQWYFVSHGRGDSSRSVAFAGTSAGSSGQIKPKRKIGPSGQACAIRFSIGRTRCVMSRRHR